jgi:hypothetical protein
MRTYSTEWQTRHWPFATSDPGPGLKKPVSGGSSIFNAPALAAGATSKKKPHRNPKLQVLADVSPRIFPVRMFVPGRSNVRKPNASSKLNRVVQPQNFLSSFPIRPIGSFGFCSRRAVAPSQRVGFRISDFGFPVRPACVLSRQFMSSTARFRVSCFASSARRYPDRFNHISHIAGRVP